MMKSTIRILLVSIFLPLLFVSSCSSSTPSYEELTDTLHSLKPYHQPYGNENDSEYVNFQKKVGLRADKGKKPFDRDSLNELMINDEFLSVYVEKYGLYDLLDHYNLYLVNSEILGYSDDGEYTSDYIDEVKSRNRNIKNLIMDLPEYNALETSVFNSEAMEKLHGSSGFYGGKKDQVIEEETSTGEFNNANNDNAVYESSRTNIREKRYYGDWAIEYSIRYDYDPGKYGWNNGTFEDESPSWVETHNVILFYKDDIVHREKTAPELLDLYYGIIDDKMFSWEQDGYDVIGIHWIDNYRPTTSSNTSSNETASGDVGKASLGIGGFDDGESAQAQYEAQGETETILTKGYYILSIQNQSLLDGGLELGDKIITLNGIPIYTREDLSNVKEKCKPGDEAVLVVSRNDKEVTVTGKFISEDELLPDKTGIVSFEINGRTFEFNYDDSSLDLKG